MDDSKPLFGKWLEITKHPLKKGGLGFQGYVYKYKNKDISIYLYQVIQAVSSLSLTAGAHQQPLNGSCLHHPKKVTIAELPGNKF